MLNNMDLKTLIGNLATVFTIAVFLSGIEICLKIWRKNSTNDVSALPFLCGLVSCSLWFRYGLMIDDTALIIVNSVGGGLQILYILWYARFTTNKCTLYKQLGTVIAVIVMLFNVSMLCANEDDARFVSGLAASSAGVIFMGSPLAAVAQVLKTKNVDMLPFPMILTTLIMGTLWLFYGIITNDLFVQIPNFLGALLAVSQLCLFITYPSKKAYFELQNVK